MDELEISGKRYISTRRAAREHGYHSDYMGQLIRGKKVAGQKVGRAWYIEEGSLNTYLGKVPVLAVEPTPSLASAPDTAPIAPVIEHLIIEEPTSVVVPEPHSVVKDIAPEPVAAEVIKEIKEEEQPVPVHIEPQPVVQEIHHAPYIEEQETNIPIRIPASAIQEIGGLRYAPDDSPSIPVVMHMPQTQPRTYAQTEYAPVPRSSTGRFPYVSLSIVAALAILATTFASNFVTATIVSEQGKAATVQYAIHW